MFETMTPPSAPRRGVRCAVFGLAMTVLARLGPWSWPGWPAVTVLDFALAHAAPSVAGPVLKGLGLVVLLVVNAGFWALLACAALRAWFLVRDALP